MTYDPRKQFMYDDIKKKAAIKKRAKLKEKADEYVRKLKAENKLLWKVIDVCEAAIDEASSFVDGYYLETGECLLPTVKEAYDVIDAVRKGHNDT